MTPQQVVVVSRVKTPREAENRKGDEGILANVSGGEDPLGFDGWEDGVAGEAGEDKRYVKVEGLRGG